MVVKPVDAYSSKGIFVCENVEQIRIHFQDVISESLKYQDRIIVEEFYPAGENSINTWVKDGCPYLTCVYDVIGNYKSDMQLNIVKKRNYRMEGRRYGKEELLRMGFFPASQYPKTYVD